MTSYETLNKGRKAMVAKRLKKEWDEGRQELIYVPENSPHIDSR